MEMNEMTKRVIGCAIAIHRQLGPGLFESAYGAAMEIAMEDDGLRFRSQVCVPVRFKDRIVGGCRPDFIVEGALIVELKRIDWMDDRAQAQVLAYLRATGLRTGLLLNFAMHPLTRGIRRFTL